MANKKITRIGVFVHEHLDEDPFEKAIAESQGTKPKGSTVGVKISAGGLLYGDYVCFTQSTLTASEVAESINKLFEFMLEEVIK